MTEKLSGGYEFDHDVLEEWHYLYMYILDGGTQFHPRMHFLYTTSSGGEAPFATIYLHLKVEPISTQEYVAQFATGSHSTVVHGWSSIIARNLVFTFSFTLGLSSNDVKAENM